MDKQTLKRWFSRGKKPTGDQFAQLIDSFRPAGEPISMDEVTNLNAALADKANKSSLDQKADIGRSYVKNETYSKNETDALVEKCVHVYQTGDVVLNDLSVITWGEWYAHQLEYFGSVVGLVCDPVKKTFINLRAMHELYPDDESMHRIFGTNSSAKRIYQGYSNFTNGKETQLKIRFAEGSDLPLNDYFPIEKKLKDMGEPYFVPSYDEIVPFYSKLFARDYLGMGQDRLPIYDIRINKARVDASGLIDTLNIFYAQVASVDMRDFDYPNIRIDGKKCTQTQASLLEDGVVFVMGIYK